MTNSAPKPLWRSFAILLLALIAFSLKAAPFIAITNVPAFGSNGFASGYVSGVSPATSSVVVFIYVPGAFWYSKPFCSPQLTPILADSSWSANITTGGSDQYATRITALLVGTNYNQPCVLGAASLPTNVTAQAVATATVTRKDTRLRWISFHDYDWSCKSSTGQVGPGPNYFSDSTNNVWLDVQGQLHLRITNRSNQWQCAEILSDRTFGYGSYRFELAFSPNEMDPNAVLGLFTWSDDPAYADREIDIESSRWSNSSDTNNSQFVVQPYNIAGHLVRYPIPLLLANSTHLFTWETNRVSFQAQRGAFSPAPSPSSVISNWVYTLDVPPTGDEKVHINLWLNQGSPPAGVHEVEAVLKNFEFVPLGLAQPASLSIPKPLPNGQFRLTVTGQTDRRYQLMSSSNLLNWLDDGTLLATNNATDFLDTNASGSTLRFWRSTTQP